MRCITSCSHVEFASILSMPCSRFRRIRVMYILCRLQGGEAEQNGPLVGTDAVEAAPIATYDANGHLVIYLGTADGHLKEVFYCLG
jgi:hypothetical protein